MRIGPFLPPSLRVGEPPRSLPWSRRITAGLLLADISGFTALTERLQERGREGAEEIADVVSAAFAPAIRAIERHDGSIECFGGDSLFVTFEDPLGAVRARATAEEIFAAFSRRGLVSTSAGPVRLRVKLAVHQGSVDCIHLGTPARRHYLVAGGAISTLARLEYGAAVGAVVVSSAARRTTRPVRRRTRNERASARTLAAYLPSRVRPVLRRFEGAYRRVAILFLETRGRRPSTLQQLFLDLTGTLDLHGGVLLKSDLSQQGTKWLCVFGLPEAHEEDPDRAARAALAIQEGLPRGLEMRGGLHAGTVANVVVGVPTRRSFEVIGDAVNTAARVLSRARWGEVLLSDGVRRALSGVETKERGSHRVKGKSEPLALHALVRAGSTARQLRVMAPMIGRDSELQAIVEALERARMGRGGAIAIEGEAGMGKSRLKHEAAQRARAVQVEVHEGRARSFGGMAFAVVGMLLKDILGLPEIPRRKDVLARVSMAAERLAMLPVDRHHLADVLGARFPDSPIADLAPRDARTNVLVAIRTFCAAVAGERPRLFVLEDMHWADEASAEAAAWLVERSASGRFLVLLLHRPGYEPPLGAVPIKLHDLAGRDVVALLGALLGRVSPAVAALVEERAGGNPFYVEEVVRHLVEAGVLRPSESGYELTRDVRLEDLPDTIETLIASRLDRLAPDVRRVAEQASVIGRRFSFDLLARLPDAARVAGPAIEELCRRELMVEAGREPHLEYAFKHALTRDSAYASILASRRRRLHRHVADRIEAAFGADPEVLGLLAHHREQSGKMSKARRLYLLAARHGVRRHAHAEAERQYKRYLSLVGPATKEAFLARNELGETVLQVQGKFAEAVDIHRDVMAAAHGRRWADVECRAARLLGGALRNMGHLDEALTYTVHARALAERLGDSCLEARVHGNLAIIEHARGNLDRARPLFESALAVHRTEGDRGREAVILGNLAVLAYDEGRLDQARALYEEAIAIGRSLGIRQGEGIWLGNLATLEHTVGESEAAAAHLRRALEIHREVGDRPSEGTALGNLGTVLAEEGLHQEALASLAEALRIHRTLGDRHSEGEWRGLQAAVHFQLGAMEQARRDLEEALAIHGAIGDRRCEGMWLSSLLAVENLVSGDRERCLHLFARAEEALATVDDKIELADLRCVRGHVELATGGDGTYWVATARQLVEALGLSTRSALGKKVGRLQRSVEAARMSHVLVAGHLPADLTPGQLGWLREHRPAAIPPDVVARLDDEGALQPRG